MSALILLSLTKPLHSKKSNCFVYRPTCKWFVSHILISYSRTREIAEQVNRNHSGNSPVAVKATSAHHIHKTATLDRDNLKKINIYDTFKAEKKRVDKIQIGTFSF